MRQLRVIVAFLLLLTFSVTVACAQQAPLYPQVDTSVIPTSGTVGERFELSITATVPDLIGLQVLPLFDTQTSWTAVGEPQIVDAKNDKAESRTFSYTVVPFETGRLEVPRVAFTYSPAGGATSSTVLSEPLWVDVNSVLSGNGSASALRDVKPPVSLPVPAAVLWTGGLIIAALLIALAFFLWRRYSARLKRMLGHSLTPPELALKEINALEDERLIEHKKIKELYTRLSDTVRRYLETAYGVQSMDLTSNELLRVMDELAEAQPAVSSDNYRLAMARLVELLDESDLVKFARLMPEAARCRKALQAGRDIVSLTSYRFVKEDEQGNKESRGGQGGAQPPVPPTSPPVHAGVAR